MLQQGIQFSIVNVKKINSDDISLYNQIKQYSNFPTFPQLYIAGKFIGGVDIVQELIENGELLSILQTEAPKALCHLPKSQKCVTVCLLYSVYYNIVI